MLRIPFGRRAGKSVVIAAAAALMLTAVLPGGVARGDGPDAPPLSSSVKSGAGSGAGPSSGGAPAGGVDTAGFGIRWNIFAGHAFAEGRSSATGLPLVACLGGCDADGYVSKPVIVGAEGSFEGLKVGRPASGAGVEVITFWLGDEDSRVRAIQEVIFQDDQTTRELALSFEAVPAANADAGSSAMAVSRAMDGTAAANWRTTDLTLPDAADLGLAPANSAAGFAATTFRYRGYPLLPGLFMALGLTVAGIGVSLLMYRRRIVW